MKRFKEFINEGAMDFLKPKSGEEIIKNLKGLSDQEKIKYIITYQLDYNLLPRNWRGRCIYIKTLILPENEITKLPENLTIKGDFMCGLNNLTELPKGLKVKDDLHCYDNNLIKLSDDLKVGKSIYCSNNELIELPDNWIVNGSLVCNNNQLTKLPENLTVRGILNCKENNITTIPSSIWVSNVLECDGNVKIEKGAVIHKIQYNN